MISIYSGKNLHNVIKIDNYDEEYANYIGMDKSQILYSQW